MQRWPSMLDNFETYKDDYTSVAEYCREYFEEQNINFEEAKKYRTIQIKVRDRLIIYEGEELQLPNKIKKKCREFTTVCFREFSSDAHYYLRKKTILDLLLK